MQRTQKSKRNYLNWESTYGKSEIIERQKFDLFLKTNFWKLEAHYKMIWSTSLRPTSKIFFDSQQSLPSKR